METTNLYQFTKLTQAPFPVRFQTFNCFYPGDINIETTEHYTVSWVQDPGQDPDDRSSMVIEIPSNFALYQLIKDISLGIISEIDIAANSPIAPNKAPGDDATFDISIAIDIIQILKEYDIENIDIIEGIE